MILVRRVALQLEGRVSPVPLTRAVPNERQLSRTPTFKDIKVGNGNSIQYFLPRYLKSASQIRHLDSK